MTFSARTPLTTRQAVASPQGIIRFAIREIRYRPSFATLQDRCNLNDLGTYASTPRASAVRMVFEAEGHCGPRWEAIWSVADNVKR